MSEREGTRVESTKVNRHLPARADLSSADPMISEEQARERERTQREKVRTRERRLVRLAEAVDQEELDPQNGPPLPLPPVPPLFLPRAVRRSAESDRDTPLHTACLTGSYDQETVTPVIVCRGAKFSFVVSFIVIRLFLPSLICCRWQTLQVQKLCITVDHFLPYIYSTSVPIYIYTYIHTSMYE